MIPKSRGTGKTFIACCAVVTLFALNDPIFAANEYWVGASGTTNAPTSGTWLTGSGTVWSDGTSRSANTTWAAGNTAFFGGTDGTYGIKVGGAITMAGMNFSASGYVLTNNAAETITGTNNPFITLASGKTSTIGTNITVSVGAAATFGAPGGGQDGGTLIIDNGGIVQQSASGPLTINGAGTVVRVKTGGKLTTPSASNTPLSLGNTVGDNVGLIIDGGVVNIQRSTSSLWVGPGPTSVAGDIQATLTITNGGALTTVGGFVALGQASGNVGVLNLDGGTLTASAIQGSGSTGLAGSGTSIVNFNGGTLTALSAQSAFVSLITGAYVRNGGAVINNNGVATTIGQGLLHTTNASDNALDGGLASSGSGTLTLTNANTYNGATVVNAGTLAFAPTASGASTSLQVTTGATCWVQTTLPILATNATVCISSGGLLYLTNRVNLSVNYLLLNGVSQTSGTWGSSSSSAANKNDSYFSGPGILTVSGMSVSPKYWVGSSGTTRNPTSGTWLTGSGTVWSDDNVVAANTTWTAGSTAFFGGLDGSYGIKVGGAITVASMNFSASGYVLTNNAAETITATNNPFITVVSGKTNTIGTNITVSVGLAAAFGASSGGQAGGTLIIDNGGTVQETAGGPLTINGSGTVVRVKTGGKLTTPSLSNTPLVLGNTVGDVVGLIIDGGLVNIQRSTSSLWVGPGPTSVAGNIQASLTITNGGALTTAGGFVTLGQASGNVGVLNLDGGTLTASAVQGSGTTGMTGAGTSIANFNGGTLTALSSQSAFVSLITAAYVRNGGAVINNNGVAITIGQSLLHTTNSLDNALDGGLTSLGSGTLTLTNVNSYSGATIVNAGTLVFGPSASGASSSLQIATNAVCQVLTTLPVVTTNATVSISSGGQLYLTNGVNLTVNCLLLNGVYQAAGTWGSSSSSAANQNNTYFSGTGILTVSTNPVASEYWVGASGTLNNPTSGTWQTGSGTVWSDGTVATANKTWTAGSTAVFGGVDGSYGIKVGGAITAAGINFLASGYALTNSAAQTITVTNSPMISVAVGKTATIGNNVTVATSALLTLGASTPGAAGGTLNVGSGGTVAQTSSHGLIIDGAGTVVSVQNGGTLSLPNLTSTSLQVGSAIGDAATLSLDGGNVSLLRSSSSIWCCGITAVTGNVQGTLTMNSGSLTTAGGFVSLAQGAGNTGTLNLNGGTLMANAITGGSGTGVAGLGTSIVNFNGGTLRAKGAQSAFIGPITGAYVRNGGAVIDDNGYAITVGQALIHSPNPFDHPVDGGLNKLGSGTLTLTNANTYTGTTTVSRGTLAVPGSISGPVVVSSTGTLSAGSTICPISISNDLTLHGTMSIKVDKSSGLTNDIVQGVGTLNYGGTLLLNLTNGNWSAGDTMSIFNANFYQGSFAAIAAVPPLPAGLMFNTANLAVNGTVSVIVDTSSPPGFPAGITPVSSALLVGDSITFTTTVTGAVPMGYQWQCDSTNIPNATNVSLTLTNLALGNAGTYTLVASNAFGMATNGSPASLSVRVADDFDLLRWAWRSYATLPTNANSSDPIISNYVAAVGSLANSRWSTMDTSDNRTYLWSDASSTNVSADVTTSYLRLLEMAQGWGTPGSSVYSNSALATDIISGLDWMYTNRYNENISEYDNWWDWEIGSPNDLNAAECVMWPLLSGAEITNYCNAVDHFSPTVNLTADNRVWKAEVVGVRGVVERNASKVAAARDGLSDVSGGGASNVFAYVTSSDGFYRDGSFIQHGKGPYTGGYGISMLADTVKIVGWLSPSQWKVTDPLQTNVVQWCYNSFQPLIYYGAMPGSVQGRYISRNDTSDFITGHGAINAMCRQAQTASNSDQTALNSMVKYWAQVDPTAPLANYVDIDLVPAAEQLVTNTGVVPRGELIGHYRFPSMDRVMHLRAGFGFGISMFSSRIVNFESINGENLHGWFTAYGMNYYYTTNDLTQFATNFWPTVDPYHLPGTTVDLTTVTNTANEGVTNKQNWVGGCALSNLFGVAGMSLADVNTPLVAKKSWFMFDNAVVCLGAGITDSTATNVNTTVENRLISSANTNVFTVNGSVMPATLGWSSNLTAVSWCALDVSGGYYFPGGANLTAARNSRSGAWRDINTSGPSTVFTQNYLSLIWDHGVKPTNATYAYVLLPNFSAGAVSNYAASPDIAVLTNAPTLQAVKHTRLNILAANFWTNSYQAVDILTASNQCSVVCGESNNILEIDVSDPTWTNTSKVAVSANYNCTGVLSADSGVTVVQTNPIVKLSVNVNGAHGSSFRVRLSTASNSPLIVGGGSGGNSNSVTAVPLTETWDGTNLVLNWSGSGALLQATNLNGPWKTNPGAIPPLRIMPSEPQMFYQVK